MSDKRILMGRIGRPHGVRGLVHLVSFTDPPQAIFGYRGLHDEQGTALRLVSAGGGADLLARIDGVADRDAAARLTNVALYADRTCLPPTDDDEFYFADLVGLAAIDQAGGQVGRVAEIHDHGAGVFLELAREGAAPMLLPFTRAAVPVVDVAGGRIMIDPPAEIVVPHSGPGAASPDRA